MTNSNRNITYIPVTIKSADYRSKTEACPQCGMVNRRHKDLKRIVIDIDLDSPTVIVISYSTFLCKNPRCKHKHYQSDIPIAGKGARYTDRAKEKVVKSVTQDGVTIRTTRARVQRDFNISPANATVSRWVNGEGLLSLMGSTMEERLTTELSGLLCIDETYDKGLAVLIAVDPVEKGKTVAYLVTDEKVSEEVVEAFLVSLKEAGINIDGAVTDGSKIYPTVLKKTIGPALRHQLCLYHLSSNMVRDVYRAIRDVVYQKAKSVKERRETLKEIHVLLQNPSNILKRAGKTLRSRKRWACRHEALLGEVKRVLERYPYLKIYSDFLKAYYSIWEAKTEEETWERRDELLNNPEFQKEPSLKRAKKRLEDDQIFKQYLYNFNDPRIPRTNNAAERACRKFRQQQKKRYRGLLFERKRSSKPVILCRKGRSYAA